MKRLYLIGFIVGMSLILAACGKDEEKPQPAAPTAQNQPAPQPPPAPVQPSQPTQPNQPKDPYYGNNYQGGCNGNYYGGGYNGGNGGYYYYWY